MQFRPSACVLVAACFVFGCTREPLGAAKPAPPSGPSPVYTAEHIVPTGSLKAAALAPGRLATIYGEHLGPAQPCVGASDPAAQAAPKMPTRLCDTEVHVSGVPAGLMYVAARQINFQTPQLTHSDGITRIQVFRNARPGPAVSVPLSADAPDRTPGQVAESMWSALEQVTWRRRYQPRAAGCTFVPPQPAAVRGGLNGFVYHCAASALRVSMESLYYPVNSANPEVLLLRADIRPVTDHPEWSAEVEQHLTRRLTQAYGPGETPSLIHEVGAYGPQPGRSWRAGPLTLFVNHNRSHLMPTGVRTGVALVAVRGEILAQRPIGEPGGAPQTGAPGDTERTLTALLRLLRQADGEEAERAAALVTADDLAVRLGHLLVQRTYQNGSESLVLSANADAIRMELAKYGVRYGEIGHYSGDLEYDHSLLRRAWTEYPGTIAGQRAFLRLQRLGCATSQFACDGPNCFLAVIEQGEKFLERYPGSSLRTEQIYHLALAHDTGWSLGQAQLGDLSARGAKVTPASAEQARLRAIDWYEELLRIAPGTPEARAAEIALPRLKLRLDTGERTFFCFSC